MVYRQGSSPPSTTKAASYVESRTFGNILSPFINSDVRHRTYHSARLYPTATFVKGSPIAPLNVLLKEKYN
ncbi:hypothetical protein ACU8KH_03355 [Lachancea thermotolerans]